MNCKCGAVMRIDDRDKFRGVVSTWYLCESCLMSCILRQRGDVIVEKVWISYDGEEVRE